MTETDELTALREAWEQPDPPSPSARAGARAALMWQAAHGPADHATPRRRHLRRQLAFGSAVTAVAVIAAAVFAAAQLAPPLGPAPDSGTEALSTGQEILLAAATTAQEQPAGSGGYWYVEEEIDLVSNPDGAPNPQTLLRWTAEDGREWTRNACCPDVYETEVGGAGLRVGGSLLTYPQLQDLPTDGEQLKAWIRDSFTDPTGWPGSDAEAPIFVPEEGEPPATEDQVAFSLANLLYQVPAPPEVRAAAFRALASMPEVTSLGPVDGGEGLRIAVEPPAADKFPGNALPEGAGSLTVVIDPTTSSLLSWTNYQGTIRILAAEWTDDGPPDAQ